MKVPPWQRVVGAVLVCLGAVEAAVLESFLVPLRVGTTQVPVSVVAAVLLNMLFVRLMYHATGSVPASVLPAVVWLAVVVLLASGRSEGDVIVPGTWVGLAMLFLGALGAALGVGQTMSVSLAAKQKQPTPTTPPKERDDRDEQPLSQ